MKTIIQKFGFIIAGLTAIQGVIAPVLYLMLLDKGITLAELGVLLAILTFFGFVFEIPFGTLADNFGRKKIFLVGEFLLIFAIVGFWLADSFIELAFVMMFNGMGTALISGTLDALFVEKHAAEVTEKQVEMNLQQAQAVFGTFQAIGLAVGGLIAGFLPIWFKNFTDSTPLINFYEINLVFLIPLVIIHLILTALIIPESSLAQTSNSIHKSFREIKPFIAEAFKIIAKSRVLLILLVLEFMGGLGAISIEQLWQPQFAGIIDAKSTTWAFGLLFTANFILVAVGQGVSIPLGRLFGNNYNRMLIVLELILVGLLLLFSFQETAFGFIVFYLLLSLVAGATVSPFMAMFHEKVPERSRSTLLSIKSMFLQSGLMIGALLAGFLAETFNIKMAWQIAAGILFFATFFYLLPSIREFGRELANKESAKQKAEPES